MPLKRAILEACVRTYAKIRGQWPKQPKNPKRIFVLRNNDIGDLIVITPIFEALKKTFPEAEIIAGIGPWNKDVLKDNPYVDRIFEITAPWHNKQSTRFEPNTLSGWIESLKYLRRSPEVKALKDLQCDIGIDVLGSPQGSCLMVCAGIPYRLGVNGYAGGSSACQAWVDFDPEVSVGRSALRFAELLGAQELPSPKPQLFISEKESAKAAEFWSHHAAQKNEILRILIGPGGGYANKCWPADHYARLAEILEDEYNAKILVVGGPQDQEAGTAINKSAQRATSLCGATNLRTTFALAAKAEIIISNSSMLMHVAGAFQKKNVVLLGEDFCSKDAHMKLWGHPQTLCLGKSRESDIIPSPEAVIEAMTEHGWL